MVTLVSGNAASALATRTFSRHAEVDAGTPSRGPRRAWCARWGGVEPVRARQEAIVPADACVELPEHDEEFIGGSVPSRRQLRDGLAELVGCVAFANDCRFEGDIVNVVERRCGRHVR